MEDNNSIYAGNKLFLEKTLKSPDPLLCSTPNRNASDSYKSVNNFIVLYKLTLLFCYLKL